MLVNVADEVEHPKMRADYTILLEWLKTFDPSTMTLLHSLQLFMRHFMVRILLIGDRECVPSCCFPPVVDNKLPNKVVKGGPEVIGDFTCPYHIVNKRFRFCALNGR